MRIKCYTSIYIHINIYIHIHIDVQYNMYYKNVPVLVPSSLMSEVSLLPPSLILVSSPYILSLTINMFFRFKTKEEQDRRSE